jgi:hypothetical protein
VKYDNDDVAQYMRNIVQTHLAHLGTRVLYTTAPYNSFDTHAGELANHTRLWTETARAISAFYDDLKEHNATDNVVLFVFTEFGRRVHDNGSGTPNLVRVKPAGVASGESWDSFGGGGSHPGKLQSQHVAEEFWKTPP